jgi:Alpha/beta hydrolase domain
MAKYLLNASFLSLLLLGSLAAAQERTKTGQAIKDAVSCNEFAVSSKQTTGHAEGVEHCHIISEESVFNIKGHRYRRVEIRLSGAVAGWVSREKGNRSAYFTDGPDFVFAQSGLTGARARGAGRYEASTGHGMTILYPEDSRQWNGKLYMSAHGAGSYGAVGTLIPRDANLKFNPLQGVNRYVSTMMDQGYAVAQTMRSSDRLKGDVTVTLEDGTKVPNFNLSSHAGLLVDWAKLAQNFVARRAGAAPKRTYFYGHSAGGFLGRLINYQPGANFGPDGKPVFDGFLIDDAGGGLWHPKLVMEGKDVLFTTDDARQKFAKQIDVTHSLYAGETEDYLQNKRENARLLLAKGLGPKHRMYEIRGVSHFDAGQVSRSDLVHQNLDLGGLFASLIERLDQWVEKEIPPAPTKSDLAELGDVNKDGIIENHAVALPEIACPLGVYHIFPAALNPGRRGGQETGFASFDGTNLEPLDGRGIFVDMNGNGVRDKRESLTQAWQRLGLLRNGQRFTQAIYVGCVKAAATKLVKDGLLPKRVGEFYAEQAAKMRLPDQTPTN